MLSSKSVRLYSFLSLFYVFVFVSHSLNIDDAFQNREEDAARAMAAVCVLDVGLVPMDERWRGAAAWDTVQ